MSHPPVEPAAEAAAVRSVVAAARAAAPSCGTTVVVAVDGRSGAGKSALADAVAATLHCPVVRVDDIYPGWDGLAEGVRILTEEVLEPLARGEPASYPTWDWAADAWGPRRDVPEARVVVVEGCGSLAAGPARCAAVAVWVEAAEGVRRTRALRRDGETYRPHWERWARQEEALHRGDPPSARADIVIRTDRP